MRILVREMHNRMQDNGHNNVEICAEVLALLEKPDPLEVFAGSFKDFGFEGDLTEYAAHQFKWDKSSDKFTRPPKKYPSSKKQ